MDAFLDGEAEATEQLQTGGEDTSSAAVRPPFPPLSHTSTLFLSSPPSRNTNTQQRCAARPRHGPGPRLHRPRRRVRRPCRLQHPLPRPGRGEGRQGAGGQGRAQGRGQGGAQKDAGRAGRARGDAQDAQPGQRKVRGERDAERAERGVLGPRVQPGDRGGARAGLRGARGGQEEGGGRGGGGRGRGGRHAPDEVRAAGGRARFSPWGALRTSHHPFSPLAITSRRDILISLKTKPLAAA